MTFMHWMKAIWAISTLAVLAQIFWLERIKRKLRKQTAILAAMIEALKSGNFILGSQVTTTRADEKSDLTTPPTVH
jgi:hypothetical protein